MVSSLSSQSSSFWIDWLQTISLIDWLTSSLVVRLQLDGIICKKVRSKAEAHKNKYVELSNSDFLDEISFDVTTSTIPELIWDYNVLYLYNIKTKLTSMEY